MSEYNIIGKRLPRVDGDVKVRGEAKYTDDMVLSEMLYGKILRSSHPHASILNINTSRAERLLGVKAVITGKNIPKIRSGLFEDQPELSDEYPLSTDKVRYIGDEIVAVAAIDEDIAEEAIELIEVDYEALEPIFDPIKAMEDNFPLVHKNPKNIAFEISQTFGDIKDGFQKAHYVREDTFHIPRTTHCAMEPHSSLAVIDPQNKLTIWSSTQIPFILRHELAKRLNFPQDDIRVIKPFVGGGFDGKGLIYSHEFCSVFLSLKTEKPVKITLTREEVFTMSRGKVPMDIELKLGLTKDGIITALQIEIIADNGAYNTMSLVPLMMAGIILTVPYTISNVGYKGLLVYTNNPPSGAQRGAGSPQVFFALESQLDIASEELGMDPVELRLLNASPTGYTTPGKFNINSCGLAQCLQKTKKKKYRIPQNQIRHNKYGSGIASGVWMGGGQKTAPNDSSNAMVKLEPNGMVSLFTGASDIGQGSDTILSQIVAEELGLNLKDIRIISGDTMMTPMDLATYASRVTFTAGNAVKAAAQDLKQKLLEFVSEVLETEKKNLAVKNGLIFITTDTQKGITFKDVVNLSLKEKGETICGMGNYAPRTDLFNLDPEQGKSTAAFSFGVQDALLHVDTETGQVKVKKMYSAHDVGFALNPMAVEGQMEGGVSGGLGQALFEEQILDNGQFLNPNFLNYQIPTALDMPNINTCIVETVEPNGPYGAKGIGESVQVPTIPSIYNGIYSATGVRLKQLPLKPDKVLESIQGKKKQ
ncbi:MAG: xanthine dehydrogenase family protein molybdopterin-binding subunit [Thermodesulfobacteriota bacterium]|nr:xanthine dehydrogenase family protein molybdopterin-binding subunit [Thermodesulfobacteriota bacterium]